MDLISDRRALHRIPELDRNLPETLDYLRSALEPLPCKVFSPAESALCAFFDFGRDHSLAFRADMDALPVSEATGLPFASCHPGKMHACGHDGHMAIALELARRLARREVLPHNMLLVFQPAEEIFEGSKDMIASGVLENPRPDAALMIHVAAGMPLPAGTVVVSAPGVSAPAADYFTIRVHGKGCHGSAPQNGIDPLTAAAHILIALQEIHARELSASDEAVLTIGTFHAGEAGNVIPDTATMGGTIRTYDEKTRAYLKERMTAIAKNVAEAFRASAEVSFGSGCPTLVNDKGLSEKVTGYLKDLLGANRAFTTAELSGGKPARGGGSEDFAYVSHEVPSLMLALAAGEPSKGYPYPQHHPKVKFDESVLSTGAAVFVDCALQYLRE